MFTGLKFRRLKPGSLPALTLVAALGAAMPLAPAAVAAGTSTPPVTAPAPNYGKLPLSFEPNQGQADPRVQYLSRGNGYGLFLTAHEAVLSLQKPAVTASGAPRLRQYGVSLSAATSAHATAGSHSSEPQQATTTDVIRMQLPGANPFAKTVAEDRLPGVSSYFLGNDPTKWHSDIPNYSRVRYQSVYPGVDLVYYGNQRQLEYDFVLAPHADPNPIRLHFDGARNLALDAGGNLVITAQDGSIAFHKPVVYQQTGSQRRIVPGAFRLLANNSVGFTLGAYDHARPLVIDPVLAYSTFFGGSGAEFVVAIAADASGSAYVTGLTASLDFPVTPGAFQAVNYATASNEVSTAFISKFNPSGTALLYSTYLGGNAIADTLHLQGDYGHAIAVDSAGNAYVAGYTYSTNFPITSGAFQKTNVPGNQGLATGFVTKLNPTGTALVYSTYLGGSTLDEPGSIAIDSSGDAFISGVTFSSNFPVTSGAYQQVNNSAAINGANLFVTKLNPTGSALVYSTYLGGKSNDGSIYSSVILTNPIAIDSSGNAYVAGFTNSPSFPVSSTAFQKTMNGSYNVTVSKLNSTGSALLYSTYLGGDTFSSPQGLAVDSSGNAYVAGYTSDTDFPITSNAFQKTNKADTNTSTNGNANQNGFITKLNPTGSALVYSTYLGGTTGPWGGDQIYGLAIDTAGDVYVAGSAMSADFPVTSNAYQPKNAGASHCCDYTTYTSDAFLTELNPAGTALVYSTYLGGSGTQNPNGAGGFGDEAYAVTLGAGGKTFLAGYTSSPNFPTTPDAFETRYTSQQNTGFVALFDLGAAPAGSQSETTLTTSANSVAVGTAITFTATVKATSGSTVPAGTVSFSVDEGPATTVTLSGGKATYSVSSLVAGAHYILASYSGSTTFAASGDGLTEFIAPITPVITPAGGTYYSQQIATVTGPTKGGVLYYTLDGATPTIFTTPYTAPLVINATKTLEAVAISESDSPSPVATAAYTIVGSPWVLAEPASAIATPDATLNAMVSTLGVAGSYHFLYGASPTALTTATAATALSASTAKVAVSARLTTLKTKTTYYYQVVVTTAGGIASGAILSFTTN